MKESHFPFILCFMLGKMRACAGMQCGSGIPQQSLCSVITASQVMLAAAFPLQPQRIFSQRSRKRTSSWNIGKSTLCWERRSCRAACGGCDVFVYDTYTRNSSAGVLHAPAAFVLYSFICCASAAEVSGR